MTTQQEQQLILLDLWASMYGMRVRIALAEKAIPYESRAEDLRNKSQLLLDMNPVYTKVPVLIHNGKPVCDSNFIVEYIDEVWNDRAPLLPSDSYEKARARFWADFVDKKVYVAGRLMYLTRGEVDETLRNEFLESLKLLEIELGDKPYFGGEIFGYLDVSFVPFYAWIQVYDTYGRFKLEDECPKLIAWAKRCIQNKESVFKSLIPSAEVLGFVQYLRKRNGIDI